MLADGTCLSTLKSRNKYLRLTRFQPRAGDRILVRIQNFEGRLRSRRYVKTTRSASAKLIREQITIVIRFAASGYSLRPLTSTIITARLPISDIAPFVELKRRNKRAVLDRGRSAQVHRLCQTKLLSTDASTANAVAMR